VLVQKCMRKNEVIITKKSEASAGDSNVASWLRGGTIQMAV